MLIDPQGYSADEDQLWLDLKRREKGNSRFIQNLDPSTPIGVTRRLSDHSETVARETEFGSFVRYEIDEEDSGNSTVVMSSASRDLDEGRTPLTKPYGERLIEISLREIIVVSSYEEAQSSSEFF